MSTKRGVLPDHMLRYLSGAGHIKGVADENIQAASIDLTLSDEIYRLDTITLPRPRMNMRQVRNMVGGRRCLSGHLAPHIPYLIRLRESVKLPLDLYGYASPRAMAGLLDIKARLVAEGVSRFDTLPTGYQGELWLFVVSRSFSVKVAEGTRLTQLRLFNANTRLGKMELEVEMGQNPILLDYRGEPRGLEDSALTDNDGTCFLTPETEAPIVGWRARQHTPEVDLSAAGAVPVEEFFDKVQAEHGVINLTPGQFHIFSSAEHVRVPPHLACEMRPMSERSDEFRAYSSGFIDPGWGWGEKGEGKGRHLTFEIRPAEPLLIARDLPIAKIGFERLYEPPEIPYDMRSPHPLRRAPQLAKQFVPQKW